MWFQTEILQQGLFYPVDRCEFFCIYFLLGWVAGIVKRARLKLVATHKTGLTISQKSHFPCFDEL